jgi:hypothetical protein
MSTHNRRDRVDLGRGEAVAAHERQERVLERGPGRSWGLRGAQAGRELVEAEQVAQARVVYGAGEGGWAEGVARSVRVRAGVVTGGSQWRVISASVNLERCTTIPGRSRLVGAVTSIGPS